MTTPLPIDPGAITEAAAVLRRGGLVAFPTETVYGLGANALDPSAVARIFAAKGRPANNPLIVHVLDAAAARSVVAVWPELADRLAQRFWPGPLTLVLPKNHAVPDTVTAGGPTVAVRVPAHPVALALLREAGVPVAAPSANRSGDLSPTTAEHVRRGLGDRVDVILDGGPCLGGLESTVLDVTTNPPRLLRPGLVSPTELAAVLGKAPQPPDRVCESEPLPSPGLLARHYAPRTITECIAHSAEDRVLKLVQNGGRIGWLTIEAPSNPGGPAVVIRMPEDPKEYAARLYAELHQLDNLGLDRIVVSRPPDGEAWQAVHDRLRRACVIT